MPYSDNTCPQCGKGTQNTIETAEGCPDGWFPGRFGRLSIVISDECSGRVQSGDVGHPGYMTRQTQLPHSAFLLKGSSVWQRGRGYILYVTNCGSLLSGTIW